MTVVQNPGLIGTTVVQIPDLIGTTVVPIDVPYQHDRRANTGPHRHDRRADRHFLIFQYFCKILSDDSVSPQCFSFAIGMSCGK